MKNFKLFTALLIVLLSSALCDAATFRLNSKEAKTSLVDADIFFMEDSAASWATKKVTSANIKAYVLADVTEIPNVSSTELGYLDGVTSSIQDQINAITVGSPITTAPTYSDDTCTVGQYAFSTSPSMYWCIATDTWDYQVVSGANLVWAGWDNPTPVPVDLAISPTSWDPADGTDGDAQGTRTITLGVTGDSGTITLSGYALTTGTQFLNAGTGTCTTSTELTDTEECTIDLVFDYETGGPYSDTLTITSDAATSPDTIALGPTTVAAAGPDVSDTFTDTDTTNLTAHTSDSSHTWTKIGTGGELVINSNKVNASVSDAFTLFYSSFDPTDSAYTISADFSSSSTGGTTPFICGRLDTTLRTGYCVNYTAGTWTLRSWVNGSTASLATYTGDDPVSTPLTVELVISDAAKIVKIGGVQRINYTTDNAITAKGRPGLGMYFSDASALRNIDNFEVTD